MVSIGFGFWGILTLIAVIWMLFDIMPQKKENSWKILWIIIGLILGIIGAALYYLFSGRASKK